MKRFYIFIMLLFLLSALQTGCATDASDLDLRLSMAYSLEKTGQDDEAKRMYQHILAGYPDSAAAHNNYGELLCRKGAYSQGIHQFLLAAHEPSYHHIKQAYRNAAECARRIPNNQLAKQYALAAEA